LNWALAVLSAALLILIHPGPDLIWLAWIALAPIIVAAARERRPVYRFMFGWSAGIIYWFGVCYWIQFVLEVHGGMGQWGGWATFGLFCILKAIHLAVFMLLAGWITGHWWSPPAIAALWIGLERTHGTFGFAWLALGNAGIDMGPLPCLAPLVGVYGLSFLFALVAAALASLRPRYLGWCAAVLVLFILPPLESTNPVESAVVVQPNLPEEEQWTTASVERMERNLLAISLEAAIKDRSRLIIWPESPGPIYYYSDTRFKQYAADLARTAQANFLFGTIGYTAEGAPLNSAVMLTPAGEFAGRYDKMYLVPFGEFIPPMFGFVNRITKEAGDFSPGTRVVTFPYRDHRLGVFICYESAFPHLVRQFALAGSDTLINISNDGYFGHSAAREQHLKLVRMRAAENRRWIIRATNDGITATIDPTGHVTERAQPYQQSVLDMRFGYIGSTTFYTRHGDWFAWLCLAIGVALPIARSRPLAFPYRRA
jgi:apolipoprotein N-acyltransferase